MEIQGAGGVPAADWYPDPEGRHEFRYWDGAAWTSNVSDRGQASVDPIGATPAPFSTPALDTPPGQTPASRGVKRFVILGAVLLLLVAVGAGGYSVVGGSLAAKDAAARSIAAARSAITAAAPAVEPGSQESSESKESTSKLEEATSLLAQGSLIDAGPYRSAKAKADQARAISAAISDRVESLASDASAASSEDAIDLYFALATKYPRTSQGQEAIANAASALENTLGTSDLGDLDAIRDFFDTSPGEVPTTVYEAAATRIKSMASAWADRLASIVSSNRSWVKKIRGKGVRFTISSTTAANTSELNHILGVLPTVHGTDFRAAVTLLRDCSKSGESCGKIARSPVRTKGRVQYFSRSQINRIATLTSQMSAKLTKARALLKDL